MSSRVLQTMDKPAGLPVLRPNADPDGDCLLARLLAAEPWRREVPWPEGFEGGVLHRLDNGTSGAVAVAASLEELRAVREAFAGRRLRKTYRLLSVRNVGWDQGACDRPIAHDPRHKGRMVVQRGRETPHRGRWHAAHTRFTRLSERCFEVVITTGVMHQIRVHAAFVGLPIAGDARYGGGDAPPGLPDGAFCLHHVGFEGGGYRTAPVPLPAWADVQSTPSRKPSTGGLPPR